MAVTLPSDSHRARTRLSFALITPSWCRSAHHQGTTPTHVRGAVKKTPLTDEKKIIFWLAVSAYSVYADNYLSTYTLFADLKKKCLDILSAYKVQKYYILSHATYSVFNKEPFFLYFITTARWLGIRRDIKVEVPETNISASIHFWNLIAAHWRWSSSKRK